MITTFTPESILMNEFIAAVMDPNIPFLRYALLAGLLSSVAFGIMGTYVVSRRITYIAGAISHCVLGGIGASLYCQNVLHWSWCHPLLGAMAAALLAALIIGWVSLHAQEREDTIISAIWAAGMAIGLLLIARTPGYVDPMSYLFGNILLLSQQDLWLILLLDGVIVGLSLYFYHVFLAVCFDEEFARIRGIRVDLFYMLLLCLTALTIVLLVRIVGIVMVIALLALPAATAGQFSRRLWQMMIIATIFCMVFCTAGLGISYRYDLPGGPTIIVFAAVAYLVAIVVGRFWRIPKTRVNSR